jgi:hypothetical protein
VSGFEHGHVRAGSRHDPPRDEANFVVLELKIEKCKEVLEGDSTAATYP